MRRHYATSGVRLAFSLGLLWGTAYATPDEVGVEADRLTAQAQARGGEAGGAVDLIRLDALGDWLPEGQIGDALGAAAGDRRRAPLVRAVAHWLLIERARRALDRGAMSRSVAALGLQTGFVFRSGSAPGPTAQLQPAGWRVFPPVADGVLNLDDVLRPARETRATLATRLVAKGGPAVLRLGYDDQVTVWLNGDEVYVAPAAHAAYLDQAAVPVVLRPGDNRLVVQVAQKDGPWRFLLRVTDAEGTPLEVTSHPDPWGACPEPIRGGEPDPVEHLWRTLSKAADVEPPVAQDLRDYVDYAKASGLPDFEQVTPRVAIEGAWASDPSPRTLHAWLGILPSDQRVDVRARHRPTRPITRADVFADARLALQVGWEHYYARRHLEVRRTVERLLRDVPGFGPTWRLAAVMYEDLNLPHTSVARLARAAERWPDRRALERARTGALRAAGRISEAMAELKVLADGGDAEAAYELAAMHRDRGEFSDALALLERIREVNPTRWTYQLEAAEIEIAAGDRAAGMARLEALNEQLPGAPAVAERLAELHLQAKDLTAARAVLAEAVKATGDEDLREKLKALSETPVARRLGPPLAELLRTPDPPGAAAHVLYHHAQATLGPDGRATRRVRRVVRVLTEAGAQRFAEWSIPYVPGTQRLQIETAQLIRGDEPLRSPSRADQDLSEPDYRLYFDLRAEVLDFGRPLPGDVIEVAWRLVDAEPDPAFPGYYGEVAYLQEATPRALSIVEIDGALEPMIEVHAAGLDVTREGDRITARAVPGVQLERGMPGPSSTRGYVHISTAQDWADVDQRYARLLGDRTEPTTQIRALADEWAGDATDPEAVLANLYTQVAHKLRYVGLEFGVRSFQPARPADTLARGYGDCKDKATLLIALARAKGIDARFTLVRTRRAGAIEPQPASLAIFDHAIVYVPQFDRFMDPTVDRNDPWTLPPSDQGAFAFVVGVDQAPRVIPMQPAARSRTELKARLERDGAGWKGAFTWQTTGQLASLARRNLEGSARQREAVEAVVAASLPGARVGAVTVSGLLPARDPVVATGPLQTGGFIAAAEGFDVTLAGSRTRLLSELAQASERETPLEIPYAFERRSELVVALAGARARLPEPVEQSSTFGAYQTRARVEDGALILETSFRLTATRVEPAEYPAFRRWLAAADQALSAAVEVRP